MTDQHDDDIEEDVRSISHGAVATVGANVLQRIITVFMNGLLTRVLGPALYSVYAVSWRLVWTLRRFVVLGAEATLIRDGARSDSKEHRSQIAAIAYVCALIGGSVFASLAFYYAEALNSVLLQEPELIPALRIFALSLPFVGVIVVNGAFLRSQHEVVRLLGLKNVGWPFVRLVAVASAASLGYGLLGIMGSIFFGTALLAVFGWVYSLYCTGTRMAMPTLDQISGFFDHSLPHAMTLLSGFLRIRIYIFLVGYFVVRKAAAGEYNVALLLMELGAIPLIAFAKLFPPVASSLYEDERYDALNRVYTAVARLIIITSLPIILYELIYGEMLLGLFGEQYRSAYIVLVLFLVARFLSNAVGSTGWLLLMTDHQYPRLVLDWILAVVNVPVAYYLIVEYGIVGAAIGNISQIIAQNGLQLLMLLYLEDLNPFDSRLYKPALAGLIMAFVLLAVLFVPIGGYRLLVGGLLGMIAYVAVLAYCGLEKLDRAVMMGLYEGYREQLGW